MELRVRISNFLTATRLKTNRHKRSGSLGEKSSEVVIVGGSAAGLFTAYLLAEGGMKVKLFDFNDVMHVAPRTLIATSQLSSVLGFLPSEAIVNRIDRIELFSPERSVSVSMKQPDFVVERAGFIPLLAKKALEAGVEIKSGYKFLDFAPLERGVTIQLRNLKQSGVERVQTQTLVGADGAFSRVAKTADLDGLERVPILQAIVQLPGRTPANAVRVWFRPKETPYFYWLLPESDTRAAVGLIAADSRKARPMLENFLVDQGLKPLEIQAAWIPLFTRAHQPWRRVSGCNIYLVGDAAGHVKGTTVGGLVTGLWGAKVAANAILRRADYEKELRHLRRELALHGLIRSVLNRFRSDDYDRLLSAVNEGAADLLGLYTRDELTRLSAKLLLAQPRLLGFMTRLFTLGKTPISSSSAK